jgi:hypothetical protein
VEIQIAGAFQTDTIIQYNRQKANPPSLFASYFPFWKYLPDLELHLAEDTTPNTQAVLLVLNLNQNVWQQIQGRLSQYKKTILVQFEAQIGWELAYEKAPLFDYFVNFDASYANHPGFHQMYIPYDPHSASSGRDKRGLSAVKNQWNSSRKLFLELYLFRFLPRKRKGSLIATLNPNPHYQVRKQVAEKWPAEVDVFGGGWPKSLSNYRGYVSSKIDLLKRYRYCIVMENQRQPGYITEKLLDGIVAGAVPLYWGAENVHSYPGMDWIPIFDVPSTNLAEILKDDVFYKKSYAQLIQNRQKILDVFTIDRFISMLCKILKGIDQEHP